MLLKQQSFETMECGLYQKFFLSHVRVIINMVVAKENAYWLKS